MSVHEFLLNEPVSAVELFSIVGEGDRFEAARKVHGVCGLNDVDSGFVSFSKKTLNASSQFEMTLSPSNSSGGIPTSNPRLSFVILLDWLCKNVGFKQNNFSPVIAPTAQVDPTAIIESDCQIGANTIIGPGVVIRKNTNIGRDCYIGPNCVIGDVGLGFETDDQGRHIRFQQLGGVTIGNNVEIGALCTVASGTLGNTVLEDNVKLDNFVVAGHNCRIGSGTLAASQSSIGGSCKIGRNVWISTAAQVINGITVGDDSFLGFGAIVIRNVKPNTKVFGNPAKPIASVGKK